MNELAAWELNIILTAALILLAWLGLAVMVAAAFHLALAPRREERRYRRCQR